MNGAIAPTHQSNLHAESKSKLIVICFKIFLHFCEDCGTFCVGERDKPGINGLVKRSGLIDLSASSNHWPISLIGVIVFGLIASSASSAFLVCRHIGLVGFIGLGLIVGCTGLLISLIDLGFAGHVSCIDFIGHVNLGDISLGNLGIISLVGSSTLVDRRIFNGIGGFNSNISLVNHISNISLIGVSDHSLNSLVGSSASFA